MPDPDPIAEQLLANVASTLAGVKKTAGFTGDFKVVRPGTSKLDASPDDLRTVVLMDDPDPVPAPLGQLGWKQQIEITIYVRESETGMPIDKRLILAAADAQRALMVDSRRGGLCYVDNKLLKPVFISDSGAGFSAALIPIECEYRTLETDPRVLAPLATNEMFFQGRATLLIAARISPYSQGPWQKLEDLKITPLIDAKTQMVNDDRNGPSRNLAEIFTEHCVKYEVDGDYLSPQLIAWQLAGGSVQSYTQAATPLVDVPHVVASKDSILPLHDASPAPIYAVASVQSVKDSTGSTTYTAGTDYIVDADSLADGFIKIPPASGIVGGSGVLVSFTPVAITGRPSIDAGVACEFPVRARIIWSASDGQKLIHGDFDGSLITQSATRPENELSTTKMHLTVTTDGSARPAGRMLLAAGPLPASSSY